MTPDIEGKIAFEFGVGERNQAQDILESLERELGTAEAPRILRCVLFLAQGNIGQLIYYADQAKTDWRDVIYWAEYDGQDRRLRDFAQPFPQL